MALYESAGKNIPLLINLGGLFVKVRIQKNQVIDGFIRMFDFIQTTCCLPYLCDYHNAANLKSMMIALLAALAVGLVFGGVLFGTLIAMGVVLVKR